MMQSTIIIHLPILVKNIHLKKTLLEKNYIIQNIKKRLYFQAVNRSLKLTVDITVMLINIYLGLCTHLRDKSSVSACWSSQTIYSNWFVTYSDRGLHRLKNKRVHGYCHDSNVFNIILIKEAMHEKQKLNQPHGCSCVTKQTTCYYDKVGCVCV